MEIRESSILRMAGVWKYNILPSTNICEEKTLTAVFQCFAFKSVLSFQKDIIITKITEKQTKNNKSNLNQTTPHY